MHTSHRPPSPDDLGASYLERGWEPPEEVVLRRELVRTPGLQPEDIGVLAELLLRDPRLPSTMEAIRRDLQAQGWKMGKDRYNAIQARLTKAGHLARVSVYDDTTQRPTWVTRVYRNPANNEQYVDLGIAASQQVSGEVRETRDSQPSGSRKTRVSPGQSRNAENPRPGAGSRKTRDPETRVSPGQSRNAENPRPGVHPPHPPEEVTTSSPYPLTDPQGSLPSQREEGEAGFALKDLHAAESFLQQLRPPHHMGAASARKYAPLLLRSMAEQGWPSIFEVDHTVLAREVTRDPQGFKRPSSLVPTRIRDLPRYAIVTGTSASHGQGAGAERCPDHPARYRKGCVECALTVPV
ncbi:hypothetical protein ACFT8Q_08155 [Streptomyces griseoincarnatus]|uniref:hypothetical protein n=1 Tax=Streptomyces sp. I4(2020) TaxID=2760981 RepID=UPI0018EE82ED|nr:hypothetical protein [Streptomyces sp. I4(2020)]MBJ6630198.1 hypothetical protein [Streptomyces sp. I4(2020)]